MAIEVRQPVGILALIATLAMILVLYVATPLAHQVSMPQGTAVAQTLTSAQAQTIEGEGRGPKIIAVVAMTVVVGLAICAIFTPAAPLGLAALEFFSGAGAVEAGVAVFGGAKTLWFDN